MNNIFWGEKRTLALKLQITYLCHYLEMSLFEHIHTHFDKFFLWEYYMKIFPKEK